MASDFPTATWKSENNGEVLSRKNNIHLAFYSQLKYQSKVKKGIIKACSNSWCPKIYLLYVICPEVEMVQYIIVLTIFNFVEVIYVYCLEIKR